MITITDLPTAMRNHKDFDFVISLLDPEPVHCRMDVMSAFANRDPQTHVVGLFEDEINPGHKFAPTEQEISNILKHWSDADMTHKRVLIHCTAGISRSTAVGIAVLIGEGLLDIDEAFKAMERIRPQLWPNDLILEHADRILKLNGELIKHNKKWKAVNSRKTIWMA